MQQEQGVHLSEIGQIALSVQDLSRAKDFYQNTLGLQFLFETETMAFFQCGSVRLMLGLSEKPQGAGTILYFKVSEIEEVFRSILAKGTVFLQPPRLVASMPDHDLWLAFLQDPDGNTLALMSEVKR